MEELKKMDYKNPPKKPIEELTGRAAGKWRFTDNYCLVLDELNDVGKLWVRYEIELERCKTADEVLGWIAQLSGKIWATPEVIGGFALRIKELLDLYSVIQHPEKYENDEDLKAIVDKNINFRFK